MDWILRYIKNKLLPLHTKKLTQKTTHISVKIKGRAYKTVVRLAMMYWAETRAAKKW